jgi:uncharacterized protein
VVGAILAAMSERDGYPQGVPCWTDLSTSDVAAAREFYGGLFGWEWDIGPAEFGHYSTALIRGRKVAAVAERMSDEQPVVWTTYFAVDDIDKFAAAVPEAGGTVLMQHDIGDQGRMGVAVDPAGAAFGVWQAAAHRGAELVNEPGTVVWNELVSPDLDSAAGFYPAVLGVSLEDMDTGGNGVYKLVKVDGRTVGGAMPLLPEMGPLPPHWGLYFEVADAAATVSQVRSLGGTVLGDVQETPQGPMAMFLDPQGAPFAVIASGSTE